MYGKNEISYLQKEEDNLNTLAAVLLKTNTTLDKRIEIGKVLADNNLETVKTLKYTDCKYKILTMGSDFDIGQRVPIKLIYSEESYDCKTHSSVKGRIDGLSKLYNAHMSDFVEGAVFKVTYIASTNEVILKKIDDEENTK